MRDDKDDDLKKHSGEEDEFGEEYSFTDDDDLFKDDFEEDEKSRAHKEKAKHEPIHMDDKEEAEGESDEYEENEEDEEDEEKSRAGGKKRANELDEDEPIEQDLFDKIKDAIKNNYIYALIALLLIIPALIHLGIGKMIFGEPKVAENTQSLSISPIKTPGESAAASTQTAPGASKEAVAGKVEEQKKPAISEESKSAGTSMPGLGGLEEKPTTSMPAEKTIVPAFEQPVTQAAGKPTSTTMPAMTEQTAVTEKPASATTAAAPVAALGAGTTLESALKKESNTTPANTTPNYAAENPIGTELNASVAGLITGGNQEAMPANKPAGSVAGTTGAAGATGATEVVSSQQLTELSNTVKQLQVALDANLAAQKKMLAMETEIDDIKKKLDSLSAEQHKARTVKKTATVHKAQPVRLKDVVVQATIPGRAWLRKKDGTLLTVRVGDEVPGHGEVQHIDPIKGVVTLSTHQVIMEE